jgi:hypothetical protein
LCVLMSSADERVDIFQFSAAAIYRPSRSKVSIA